MLPARREDPQLPEKEGRAKRLLRAFLSDKMPTTLEGYRRDLTDFTRFVGAKDSNDAARVFLGLEGNAEANELALDYKEHLFGRGLAPATINRRLSMLRSLNKAARICGFVNWKIEISNMRRRPYRDTKGPGGDGFKKLIDVLKGDNSAMAARDRALLSLMFYRGLRRKEVVGLNVEDVDFKNGRVSIVGKGHHEPEWVTLPGAAMSALEAWIAHRDPRRDQLGQPLFVNFDRAKKGARLTGRSVARSVARVGKLAGITARPHGLRHASITELLDETDGNVRKVQKFSRHSKIETLMLYDDNRQDVGGEMGRLLERKIEELGEEEE